MAAQIAGMVKVLDSSAALALLQNEPGSDLVFSALDDALMSSLNVAEVLRVLVRSGASSSDAKRIFARLQVPVSAFDYEQAVEALEIGILAPQLSLGDCACLALARLRSAAEVLTADRVWKSTNFGVPVVLIR
jgi:ribonuclease VapC